MNDDEKFVRGIIPLLLAHPKVLAETKPLGGKWALRNIIDAYSGSGKRFIQFKVYLVNECFQGVSVSGEIERLSRKISNVKIGEQ